jgi:hypothetical protein
MREFKNGGNAISKTPDFELFRGEHPFATLLELGVFKNSLIYSRQI